MWKGSHELTESVWMKIRRNIDLIVELDLLVEVNSRGWKKELNSAYPMSDIMQVMVQKGCKFTLSDDSHGTLDVGTFSLFVNDTINT